MNDEKEEWSEERWQEVHEDMQHAERDIADVVSHLLPTVMEMDELIEPILMKTKSSTPLRHYKDALAHEFLGWKLMALACREFSEASRVGLRISRSKRVPPTEVVEKMLEELGYDNEEENEDYEYDDNDERT